jgi:hypothetical protein
VHGDAIVGCDHVGLDVESSGEISAKSAVPLIGVAIVYGQMIGLTLV